MNEQDPREAMRAREKQIPPELHQVYSRDPFVHASMQMFVSGEMSLQQAMVVAIVALAEALAASSKANVENYWRTNPVPVRS